MKFAKGVDAHTAWRLPGWLVAAALLVSAPAGQASTARRIQYDGVLEGGSGTAIVVVRLYRDAEVVWGPESHIVTSDEAGSFRISIGSTEIDLVGESGVPDLDELDMEGVELEVAVGAPGGEALSVLSPRAPVIPAFHALVAGRLKARSVVASQLANESVTAVKIETNPKQIGPEHVAPGQVTSAKIGSGEILSRHVEDNQVTGAKIADGAVEGTAIATGAIRAHHIKDRIVYSRFQPFGLPELPGVIVDGSVNTDDLMDQSVEYFRDLTSAHLDVQTTLKTVVNGGVSTRTFPLGGQDEWEFCALGPTSRVGAGDTCDLRYSGGVFSMVVESTVAFGVVSCSAYCF